jgi:hypothetical protein
MNCWQGYKEGALLVFDTCHSPLTYTYTHLPTQPAFSNTLIHTASLSTMLFSKLSPLSLAALALALALGSSMTTACQNIPEGQVPAWVKDKLNKEQAMDRTNLTPESTFQVTHRGAPGPQTINVHDGGATIWSQARGANFIWQKWTFTGGYTDVYVKTEGITNACAFGGLPRAVWVDEVRYITV